MNLTLNLKTPVTGRDGMKTDALTLRELTVDELIVLERANGGHGVHEYDRSFFAMSCGVPHDVIGGMGQRDWTRLKNRYWETLGKQEPESTSLE